MASDNQITVVGNLTDDPELRYTANGAAVANFTVAHSSVIEIEADEVGPSLKWATAKVEKTSRSGSGSSSGDWGEKVTVPAGGADQEETPLDAE
ncbi:MAG: single-stranded DNA-binding protein [Actinobacteria bacterium]|nr:single-stranded DNA-binding protein [Actinomycetota bacterium]